jgi:hypothetical protein
LFFFFRLSRHVRNRWHKSHNSSPRTRLYTVVYCTRDWFEMKNHFWMHKYFQFIKGLFQSHETSKLMKLHQQMSSLINWPVPPETRQKIKIALGLTWAIRCLLWVPFQVRIPITVWRTTLDRIGKDFRFPISLYKHLLQQVKRKHASNIQIIGSIRSLMIKHF